MESAITRTSDSIRDGHNLAFRPPMDDAPAAEPKTALRAEHTRQLVLLIDKLKGKQRRAAGLKQGDIVLRYQRRIDSLNERLAGKPKPRHQRRRRDEDDY